MIVPVPHRRRKGYELELQPGEEVLGSWMVGATGYTWVFAATVVLILAMALGFFLSRDGAAGTAIASVLSGNLMLFAALGKRKLYLTDQRLVLRRSAKQEQAIELSDVSGIEVQGRRLGKISIAARRGDGISASVYAPLKVAAEIQQACAAINDESESEAKGGRE